MRGTICEAVLDATSSEGDAGRSTESLRTVVFSVSASEAGARVEEVGDGGEGKARGASVEPVARAKNSSTE